MPSPLRLALTDYIDSTRWRWVLSESNGTFLADHTVRLDPSADAYDGFRDVVAYLNYHAPIQRPDDQLQDVGRWIGEHVFGGLCDILHTRRSAPATPVQVEIPPVARDLLTLPFELACFANGTRFVDAGLRFVYRIAPDDSDAPLTPKAHVEPSLRILAAFSLPVRTNPLNLRRERYELEQFVNTLRKTQSKAIDLRVLQYGATRTTLRNALEEAPGWDVVHLSGHGEEGALLLEDDAGGSDAIDADELGALLELTRSRLKLLVLSACYSGAGTHAAARAQVGLEPTRRRDDTSGALEAAPEANPETDAETTVLPNLAVTLTERLDCGALAMRYAVGDAFCADLTLALYDKLLDKGRALPAALQLALDDATREPTGVDVQPLSWATPILVGPAAATLQLPVPQARTGGFALPDTGLRLGFEKEPQRFVGRIQPMRRSSQALAHKSDKRGVLFYGMPGAGKTTCALELAYRHETDRFTGYVWYEAPQAESDVSGALPGFMVGIQTQLNAPNLGLLSAISDPDRFRTYTLPRLKALLEENSLLFVLDNLETLLTERGDWRDPLWGDVVETLLRHSGLSRVVLTSRRPPAGFVDDTRVQSEAIHALSFAESVLLANELPHLRRLFGDADGRTLLRRVLRVVQGHPKLLEFANDLAADRAELAARVDAAEDELNAASGNLDAFFAADADVGDATREGETRQTEADFVRALQGWTESVLRRLSPTARLLFTFLCQMEPKDRTRSVVDATWDDFLNRLGEDHAAAARATPGNGLDDALNALDDTALLTIETPPDLDADQRESLKAMLEAQIAQAEQTGNGDVAQQKKTPSDLDAALDALVDSFRRHNTTYAIHPGVAEAALASADAADRDAVDVELGNHFVARASHRSKNEMQGGTQTVVDGARRATPYLVRQERWREAATVLEQMIRRDASPERIAFAIPLLQRIVQTTTGTTEGAEHAGVLANALQKAKRNREAEEILNKGIEQSESREDNQLASAFAGHLFNLLFSEGRLSEALDVVKAKIEYTQRAGLGPWTRLGNQRQRLQVLAMMGRYEEVLEEVEALIPEMNALPDEGDAPENVMPWNVREGLLETGRTAALRADRWEKALKFGEDIIDSQESRDATDQERAWTQFNNNGPLIRLKRYDEARDLLEQCRDVFSANEDVQGLGMTYAALADLEDELGNQTKAIRFQKTALAHAYQANNPNGVARDHHNLSLYLEQVDADPDVILAHRLAAASLRLQMQSGALATSLRALSLTDLPSSPPPFDDVVRRVEATEGVRFRALFERRPQTGPDGDAALSVLWERVRAL